MAGAIESCVHCGFCLPTCPTYRVLQEEMDSPRGRIVLMKGVLEEDLELESALPYVDRCLGCLACVTACPSGVEYGELLTAFRGHAEPRRLLRAIPNLTLVEPAEWELCCGSAGTYNLEQPAIAGQLGRRKAANLEATGAGLVVAGNVGCLAQLRRYTSLPMLHTMQLLDGAFGGRPPAGPATGGG